MLPVVLGAIGVGGGGLFWYLHGRSAKQKAQRKIVFDTAMHDLNDPDKLRSLADVFQQEGLLDEANQLRAKANSLISGVPMQSKGTVGKAGSAIATGAGYRNLGFVSALQAVQASGPKTITVSPTVYFSPCGFDSLKMLESQRPATQAGKLWKKLGDGSYVQTGTVNGGCPNIAPSDSSSSGGVSASGAVSVAANVTGTLGRKL